MNELVAIRGKNIVTNSLIIAEGTQNEHRAILQLIGKYEEKFNRWGKVYFSHLKCGNNERDLRGRPTRIAFLNEQQATFLITLLRNTDIVLDFKSELVDQFYKMREMLNDPIRIATRYQGKLTRLKETDVIKQLVAYAETQGSKNSDKLYLVYTRLANKVVGLKSGERDVASVKQLNTLDDVESMIFHIIQRGMAQCKHYKEIYQDCKIRLDAFLEITFGEQRLIA